MLTNHSDRGKAIVFMVCASLSFAVMQTAVKVIPDIPVFQKVFVRNLTSLAITLWMICKTPGLPLFGTSAKSRVLLVLRSFLGLMGVFLIFYAIEHLTIADASIFMRLSPFWVLLLATMFLGEKLRLYTVCALLLAFLGALAIIRPGFTTLWEPSFLWAALAALAASFFAGSAYILVSVLKSYEKPETIVFFFSLFSVGVMLPFTLLYGVMPSVYELWCLLVIGVSAAAGQLFLTHSYRLGRASEVSVYFYTGIIFAVIIDFLIWQNIPSFFTILGGGLITAAGFIVYYRGRGKD
ncbi:MAG: DMT family transporter [Fibrobacterota bacterium]